MGRHEGDGAVQAEGRVLQILEHVQVEQPVRLRLYALTCSIGFSLKLLQRACWISDNAERSKCAKADAQLRVQPGMLLLRQMLVYCVDV